MSTVKSPSENYDLLQCGYQGKDGSRLLEKLPLTEGSTVLDLGCGTGYLSNIIAARVGHSGKVIAVDPNFRRLEIAKRNYCNVKHLYFMEGNSERFPEYKYDVVFANQVIQWIESKESLFSKIYNNIKVGGYFAFLCPEDSANGIFENIRPDITQVVYYLKGQQYEDLAIKCGFDIQYMSVEKAFHHFDSTQHLIKWILATINEEENESKIKSYAMNIRHPVIEWKKIECILRRI